MQKFGAAVSVQAGGMMREIIGEEHFGKGRV